jgi:transitional endoplasmic reticulum ATPase
LRITYDRRVADQPVDLSEETLAKVVSAARRAFDLAGDLDALAVELDGYSAADCVALLREAALTAMRRSIDAADVTADDVAKARENVRPSLDPVQVEALKAFPAGR